MSYHSNMTSKGQVTVPKDIRDALGLLPGCQVEFKLDAEGNAILRKANDEARLKAREEEFIHRVQEVRRKFKAMDTMPNSGMDGLAYQRWLRGDEFEE
ncbi:MAG: type II toxin-antitoxin system PrlF family antitoxin [Novosphingobium sp.]|nr:type II toxin-antitoxin system PrlF family antitoxin [Novosphingobium sp.]